MRSLHRYWHPRSGAAAITATDPFNFAPIILTAIRQRCFLYVLMKP
jgi:hypothetical protein